MHPLTPALHWVFRIGVLMCFVGHGAFGVLTKPAWFPYFAVVGIGAATAVRWQPLIGVHDISLGVFTFLSPRPLVLLWMIVWCVWTALLRPFSGQGWWEFLERAGNYGVPIAFLLLAGWPRLRGEWLRTIRPRPVPPGTLRRAATVLRWTTGLLLIGHGGFGAFQHKEMLSDMYAHAGIPVTPWLHPSLVTSIGIVDILLGVTVLLYPAGALLLFVCGWKIASELLYPMTGAPWWEFVERGGSYTAPLLLFLAQRIQRGAAPRKSTVPAFTPAAMALAVAILLAVAPPARAGGEYGSAGKAAAGGAEGSGGETGGAMPGAAMGREPAQPARGPLTAADTARVDAHFTAPSDTALVRMLRGGGYLIVFRHGKTDWNQRDNDVLNFADRSTQRNLSEEGRAELAQVGKAIAALRLPIGEVHASPFWRCRDTAELVFGRSDTTSALFEKGRTYRRLRRAMLGMRPKKGTDNGIVTHQDALIPLTTLKQDQLKEGEALIVEPLGDTGFRVVDQLAPADWLRLAAAAGVTIPGDKPAAK